ncbi:hypothetical protein OXX59_006008 [Metschnikowia pulcherrima]
MIQSFEILATHKIVGFPDGNIFSWCSQMDLLAVSMNQTSIWVFRLDGERVYAINNRAKILHLQWSLNGKFFALSGTDHQIKVYDSNNGKLVNSFATSADSPITLVSWTSINVPHSISPDNKPAAFQDLFKIDVLDDMPKLANEIDSSTDASGVANTEPETPYETASVTNTTENDATMDYLLVASGDSHVSVTFNNLFTVSGIKLPGNDVRLLKHTVDNDFFSQSFLVQDSTAQLHLQKLHINVVGPRNRSFLFDSIRWASQVISITNHISDQLGVLQAESKEFLSLYDRYISNYKDALFEDVKMTEHPSGADLEEAIVADLGGMLLTGLIPSETTDFWLNQFGERGLMRLSASGNNVYDNVRKVMFTQLILGSEKLIVLLSHLESLSKSADVMQEDNYGVTLTYVQKAVSLTQDLVKKIYEFIWRLNDEHEYFNQFLNWAKIEILEKLSKEDSDPDAFFEENPTMEFKTSSIMEYFSDFLFHSVLMRDLDLDGSGHEMLVKKTNPDTSIKAYIHELQISLKSLLFDMEASFVSKICFDASKPLFTSTDGSRIDSEIFRAQKLISAVQDNKLCVVATGDNIFRKELNFSHKIISHKLVNANTVLVLSEVDENTRKVELVDFGDVEVNSESSNFKVLKSLEFGPGGASKKPAYMTVNSIEEKATKMALILDESKKDYIIIRI